MTEEAILKLIRDMSAAKPLSRQKPFEIRSYGKSELAMLYFPNAQTAKGALNNLKFWINYNELLREELRALGFPPRAHHFRKKEVELIVKYLSEP